MSVTFHRISHDRFVADIGALATQIEQGGWLPHHIVGIGRGGLVPGTFLSHRTGIPQLSVDHSSKVHDFAEALLVRLAGWTRRGERYLFVDDINDTGKTIAHLRAAIHDNGGDPANVRYAVLVNNLSSRETVDYFAWTIDRRVDKDWLIFPWESVAPSQAIIQDAREDPDRLGLEDI